MAWTEREINLFESNCVNIGYNMCLSEVYTILSELVKKASTEELPTYRKIKDEVKKLKCVWKRN